MRSFDIIREREPEDHTRHDLHAQARDFAETNCYVDVWIEVLHALGLEPTASLSFTFASEFEGDQWTFFKPPLADIERLYGIRVEELTIWRPLLDHAVLQTSLGRMPLVEVDSFFLPDTRGTDYRNSHVKTTIAMVRVDANAQTLHYFHNAGFYRLTADDFRGIFESKDESQPRLPPYSEIIKLDRTIHRTEDDLREVSFELARRHHGRRPEHNPVAQFAGQFQRDLEELLMSDLSRFHAYSFASLRQLGANYELAAAYCRWLGPQDPSWHEAAEAFTTISGVAKMLILKVARMITRRRPQDVSEAWAQMTEAWDRAMGALSKPL